VERVNRNLKSALKVYHHESQNLWDDKLSWLGLTLNTASHKSTGTTPDILFLGREMQSPLNVRWDLSPKEYDSCEKANEPRWAEASLNLLAAKKKVARRYNLGRKADQFCGGYLVRYRLHLRSSMSEYFSQNVVEVVHAGKNCQKDWTECGLAG